MPHPDYLEAALMAPQHNLHYTDGGVDLFDLAAVYLYHMARGHAFVDGNKRTAYLTALTFLDVNGINIILRTNILELAEATVATSEGELDKPALAELMRRMTRAPEEDKSLGEEVLPLTDESRGKE